MASATTAAISAAAQTEVNPLIAGVERLPMAPTALVIFGATGDLARRKLLPALYNLRLDGVLPANFAVVGFARTEHSDASYRALARESVEKYSRRSLDDTHWADFERAAALTRNARERDLLLERAAACTVESR